MPDVKAIDVVLIIQWKPVVPSSFNSPAETDRSGACAAAAVSVASPAVHPVEKSWLRGTRLVRLAPMRSIATPRPSVPALCEAIAAKFICAVANPQDSVTVLMAVVASQRLYVPPENGLSADDPATSAPSIVAALAGTMPSHAMIG